MQGMLVAKIVLGEKTNFFFLILFIFSVLVFLSYWVLCWDILYAHL